MSVRAGDERLGPYCLREQLGEGGMGVVYLGSDPDGRPVAIKVLRPVVASDPTARRRLAHEVSTMRRVASPNVAEVIDADLEGDPPYIVTRYVPGRTLDDIVTADGPLTGLALASLARGLAAALVAVHAAGVVHRDLKPGNVMLVDGEPVVIDFGIAQAADSTKLTMTGMFMGTPGYLAPEVIEGLPSGQAADIHSWGATIAYAATGRPPFGTGSFEAIFYRIVNGQPDLGTMPAALLPLVAAALARDPARRPSAAELASQVARLDAATLVPGPTATAIPVAASATGRPSSSTAVDMRSGATLGLPAAAAAAPWPGTRPFPVGRPDDFADLITPVRYDQAAGAGNGSAGYPPATRSGAVQPGPGQPGYAQPLPWQPGRQPAGAAGYPADNAAGRARGRLPMVLATLVVLVSASVLLPIAGAAAALAALICLRAADLTAGWLGSRRARRGADGGGVAAATAFYPWAVFRSVVRFVLLAPLAVLSAAAAATIGIVASGPASLPRIGGWAAGALVACYCIGPGSAACRRPMGKAFGSLTRSRLGALAGFIGLAAAASVAVTAAVSLDPGYWPAVHLGQQLQTATVSHPVLNQLPGNIVEIGKRLLRWASNRL
jgi:predicted Ser/Thr protein kinase